MAGAPSETMGSGVKTFEAAGTIRKNRRVVISTAGTVTEALVGASGDFQAVALDNAVSGEHVACRLKNDRGTFKLSTAGAVTAMAVIYGAAAGQVDDASSGTAIGVALEAATAANDEIECLLT